MTLLLNFKYPFDDPLGVLSSTAAVMEKTVFVRLDPEATLRFARLHAGQSPPLHAEDNLHCTHLPPDRFLNYLLVLEALNFCFWDFDPRWRVPYGNQKHDGYWALTAALHRAIEVEQTPLWDAGWLANVTDEQVAHLLRGEGRPIPLLAERANHLREVGTVLSDRWEGQFANTIQNCERDAVRLVNLIAQEFSSFQDQTESEGRTILFLKRAQICVADLNRMLPNPPGGSLKGIEHLTAFADYKVPQVMRATGVLVLDPQLADRIDRLETIPANSPEEIALRAATIWGCEWLARAITKARPAQPPATAADVDYLLWSFGQDKSGLPPYHRTRTIFY